MPLGIFFLLIAWSISTIGVSVLRFKIAHLDQWGIYHIVKASGKLSQSSMSDPVHLMKVQIAGCVLIWTIHTIVHQHCNSLTHFHQVIPIHNKTQWQQYAFSFQGLVLIKSRILFWTCFRPSLFGQLQNLLIYSH